jgi:2-polyprenyl-6-methoxyphenol hydroxylase-like FAD-dependent oxidoreductase
MTQTPVIIIGGGPAGLAAAIELGWRGVECVLLEPRTEVSHTRPRGKTTHARTMEHFRRWGVSEELRARSTTPPEAFHDVAFVDRLLGRELHRFANALAIHPDRQPQMAEPGLFVGQPVVEELLRERLASLEVVDVRLGSRATAVRDTEAGVEVEVEDSDGARHVLAATYCIAADGPRSQIRASLGIDLDGGDAGRASVSALFRAPDLWERVPHDPAVFYWSLARDCPGNVSPYDIADDLWVASWQDAPGLAPDAAIAALTGDESPVEVLTVDRWQSRTALARHYRAGRIFLVGDAAKQTPPWGGHGYNTCVQDAVDVSWKLAAVLSGWADPAILDTYEIERRPVAELVIATSTQNLAVLSGDLTDLVAAERPPAETAAAIETAKRREFRSLGLVLGYSYAGSPTVAAVRPTETEVACDTTIYAPSFEPGHRLPHVWLTDGSSLFDRLGTGFAVLSNDPAVAERLGQAPGAAPTTVVPMDLLPDDYDHPEVVLVRPDQHITWVGRAAEVDPASIWDLACARSMT